MPNWCENEVSITGSKEDIAALKELIGESFDFNKIIPMPECLEADSHGRSACDVIVILDRDSMVCHAAHGKHGDRTIMEVVNAKYTPTEDLISLAQAVIDGFTPCTECINTTTENNELGQGLDFPIEESVRRLQEYGTDNWYDWKIKNWGTKWGVDADCDYTETSMSARFDTAWSPPEPIYYALVDKFPDLDIKWHYNEPGMGFSGDFETDTHNDFADPCECDDPECEECHPENYDEDGNYTGGD